MFKPVIYLFTVLCALGAPVLAQPELDIAFNGSGRTSTTFDNSAIAYKPLIQPDNKVIAVGVWNSAAGGSYFTLTRYNTDGSSDTSFGDQGKVLTDFHATTVSRGGAFAGAIQPDGKIVAAGFVSIIHPGNSYYAMARYNADGSLDTGFGTSGTVLTQFNTSQHEARAIAIGTDGKIVLAGSFMSGQTTQTLVIRFNQDGSRDMTFGSNGMVTDFRGSTAGDANRAFAAAIQQDGKIIIGGSFGRMPTISEYDITFARFNDNGSLDITFGTQGRVLVQSPTVTEGIAAIVLQPDGRILAAGYSGTSFLVMRLLEDGSQDPTFSDDGRTTVPTGGFFGATGLLPRPNGKILVTGPAQSPDGFTLLSFNADGTPDTSFSGDGKLIFGFPGTGAASYGIAIDGLGRPVLSGPAGSGFGVARLYTLDPELVSVTGRTVDTNGTPIRNLRVGLSGANGETRWTVTSAFGFYQFDNVPTGRTYTVAVRGAKRYIFDARDFGLNEPLNGIDLVGTIRPEERETKAPPVHEKRTKKSYMGKGSIHPSSEGGKK